MVTDGIYVVLCKRNTVNGIEYSVVSPRLTKEKSEVGYWVHSANPLPRVTIPVLVYNCTAYNNLELVNDYVLLLQEGRTEEYSVVLYNYAVSLLRRQEERKKEMQQEKRVLLCLTGGKWQVILSKILEEQVNESFLPDFRVTAESNRLHSAVMYEYTYGYSLCYKLNRNSDLSDFKFLKLEDAKLLLRNQEKEQIKKEQERDTSLWVRPTVAVVQKSKNCVCACFIDNQAAKRYMSLVVDSYGLDPDDFHIISYNLSKKLKEPLPPAYWKKPETVPEEINIEIHDLKDQVEKLKHQLAAETATKEEFRRQFKLASEANYRLKNEAKDAKLQLIVNGLAPQNMST